jgi:DNA-binding response OmpR family regulator
MQTMSPPAHDRSRQAAHKSQQHNHLRTHRPILVVEDERDLAELLAINLSAAGYSVAVAHDGLAALRAVADDPPSLLLLDLMLPELSGLELAARLRADPQTSDLPILMLTAKVEESDQIAGLRLGADDYVTKPFSMKVLLERVAALLRRSDSAPLAHAEVLRLGPIRMDLQRFEVAVAGRPIALTLTEFRLLAALIEAGGRAVSRATLVARAIGPGIAVTERTIDVHVTAIRRKLGSAASLILTVRGVGYKAVPETPPLPPAPPPPA